VSAKRARRNQALAEVDRFVREFETWKQEQQDQRVKESGDPRRQYDSQLEALAKEILGATSILRSHLENEVDVSGPSGAVYRECGATEEELLWLWRVWDYFREKFDQRLNNAYSATLLAADEVVWSCYRPFFRTLKNGRVPEPAPLPYIEGDFSPSALRSDRKEVLARRGDDFKLTLEAFQRLPIPILKLPVTAIGNPWSLVLVGHEIGHIIQPMIGKDFPSRFAGRVANAVSHEDGALWEDWAAEIFADWYAIVTMGQWVVWAMGQFEMVDRPKMLERRGPYPAPLVRLKLLAAMAESYGLPVQIVLSDLGVEFNIGMDDPPELRRDDAAVPAVAQAIADMPELNDLLLPLQFAPDKYAMSRKGGAKGEVEEWSDVFIKDGPQPPKTNVRSARMAAAGLAHAWNDVVVRSEEPPADSALDALRTKAREAIAQAAEPSVRAAYTVRETGKPPGRALLDFFRESATGR
jgi:hypothetical protein